MRQSRLAMTVQTRAKLIDAARAAFGDRGYAESSLDEIAATAGLTRGAVYHHFGDKKGLFQAVVNGIDEEIDEKISEVTRGNNSLWANFLMESRCYLEFMLVPEVQQIIIRDGRSVLGDINDWPSQQKYYTLMVETLSRLMDAGVVKRCDAYALARQIYGALFNAANWIADAPHPYIAMKNAWEAFALLMNGLRTNGEHHNP